MARMVREEKVHRPAPAVEAVSGLRVDTRDNTALAIPQRGVATHTNNFGTPVGFNFANVRVGEVSTHQIDPLAHLRNK